MPKKAKTLPARVGDIVRIDFSRHGSVRYDTKFIAKITKIWLQDDHVISYVRVDGVYMDNPLCNISYITEILERAPYVCSPQPRINVFATCGVDSRTLRFGGRRMNFFSNLVKEVLAKVDHIDLTHPLNRERAIRLYSRDSCPGRVAPSNPAEMIEGQIEVRWKTFCRWVRRNAQHLVMSKKEARQEVRQHQGRLDDLQEEEGLDDEHYAVQGDDEDHRNAMPDHGELTTYYPEHSF